MSRSVAFDLDTLTIPVNQWPMCLRDASLLAFPEWQSKWVPACPSPIHQRAWDNAARSVYSTGPLVWYRSQHIN